MSEPPTDGSEPVNPYATSPYAAGEVTRNPLTIPAIILITLAGLFLILLLVALPIQYRAVWSQYDPSNPYSLSMAVSGMISFALMFVASLLVLLGAVCMLRQKYFGAAMTAAIVSIIPICSPCYLLGIPFGIWALVLLLKPEVKARFR